MSRLRAVISAFRIPFLALTFVCVFLGATTAHWAGAPLDLEALALVLLGALAAHVSVNSFNEYFDFKSGLDLYTVRTPWSGGSGALPMQPGAAGLVLMAAVAASAVTIICGLLLVQRVGAGLIPLGLAGLALVYTYTQWLNREPLLTLVAPGTGFALMVLGTYYVLAGEHAGAAVAASLPVFFLVSNLLLLNQFPDVDADRRAGRRNFPIVIGRPRSAWLLGGFFAAAYVALGAAVSLGYLPRWALLGLATVPLASDAFNGARRHADDIPKLMPALARNALVTLLTPLLIGTGLLIAAWFGIA